jgi:hypothetical protein
MLGEYIAATLRLLGPGRFLFAIVLAAAAGAVGSAGASAAVPTTWCGFPGPQSSIDRKPDLLAGDQVGVIYVHPSDQPDRIDSFGNLIATDMASADAWWRLQDATRTLRFDLFAFPNCSGMARLDIVDLTLPHDAAYYRPSANNARYRKLYADLLSAPSLSSPYKKYVVYFDGPSDDATLCGQSSGTFLHGPDYAFVYAQSCGLIGNTGLRAHAAVHELIHALSAVAPGAPNECPPPDNGHVCDSMQDILYPVGNAATSLDTDILDFNRNDYYGTNGPEDIRKSPWLTFLDAQLQSDVVLNGTGTGTVQSDLSGIDCPALCSNQWNKGTQFSLIATAAADSRFVKWSGPCGDTNPMCAVTMNGGVRAEAIFALQIPLALKVDASRASGTVVSSPAGLSCPGTCKAGFDKGQTVTLTARPGAGARLEAWGGACSGRGSCSVTADAAKTVSASFGVGARRLTASVAGKGKIVSSPSGISCPSKCVAQFVADATISLRAIPAKGYKLGGWTGACKGRAGCAVKLNADATVRATFKRR